LAEHGDRIALRRKGCFRPDASSASPRRPLRRSTCSASRNRIVGISGYVVRPPQARREKPRVSAFASANIDKILAPEPDLVLTFSDLQADIAERHRGPRLQPAERRRHPRHDPHARRDGGRERAGRSARQRARGAINRRSIACGALAETPKSVLRRVGRSTDLGDRLGGRPAQENPSCAYEIRSR
jgi:hypothetical protein